MQSILTSSTISSPSPTIQLLGTFNGGEFRLHTQCFWVACEFPIESSDDLKMFLHVSVHVQYQSWELKQLFSPVLQMSFLGLGLLRSWNWNNCSSQYCKVYFLRLVLPYSLLPFFSQESRLPLVWNFLHMPNTKTQLVGTLQSQYQRKAQVFAFLWKTSKASNIYHDQASLLSKVNYQTNTSTYASYSSIANKKYPIPGATVCSKVATQRPNNTGNFLMEIFKSIASLYQDQASMFKSLYGRPTLLKKINTVSMIPDQQHWPTIEHVFLVPRKTRKDETIF